jgi:hypothetical protein
VVESGVGGPQLRGYPDRLGSEKVLLLSQCIASDDRGWRNRTAEREAGMTGKGAWLVASYEIDMHETLFEAPSPRASQNAHTESIVLHARQLCEIFLSRSAEADNIKLADLVPKDDQSERLKKLIAELRAEYGDSRTEGSPCWVFNKMLMHPTTQRTDRYDYESALNRVRPILKTIIAEIEYKKGPFSRGLRA